MEDKLINIEDMKRLLIKRFWIIIVVVILTTTVGIYKASKMYTLYTGSVIFLVSTNDNLLENYSEDEIKEYTSFMNTFNEVIKVGDYLEDTFKKSKIEKNANQVKNNISYSVSSSAPIFTLYYTSYDDNEIEKILNAICNNFGSEIKEINPKIKVKKLQDVTVAKEYPNKFKVIMIAAAIGIIVSISIILLLDYLDDRIDKKEQLEGLLPVPVLGIIPRHEREFAREERNNVHSK